MSAKAKTKHQKVLAVPQEVIEGKILLIRGKKVMLDRDLAKLYKVPTKRLNEQVKRNIERFPEDFMFQLSEDEAECLRSHFATLEGQRLRSQMVTLDKGRGRHSKYRPYVFTEPGVAMLSSVLNSSRAIQVNIQIMRTFIKLRELLLSNDHKNSGRIPGTRT